MGFAIDRQRKNVEALVMPGHVLTGQSGNRAIGQSADYYGPGRVNKRQENNFCSFRASGRWRRFGADSALPSIALSIYCACERQPAPLAAGQATGNVDMRQRRCRISGKLFYQ
jgi:hypothetical protein